jgi:hypothetical protein
MRNDWRAQAVVVIVSAFAVAGCSSTQPDRAEGRLFSLGFTATALMDILNCYEAWQDTSSPPDEIPDVSLGYMLCVPAVDDTGVPKKAQRPVPWRYSIKITVIRAGTTNEDLVTSLSGEIGSSVQPGDSVDDFVSMTRYDPEMPPVPPKHEAGSNVYFINGKQVSRGSPVYLASLGIDAGVPNILATTPTFDFNLNTGDTVVVRARKQSMAQAPHFIPPIPNPEIRLTAALAVSDVEVSTQGDTTSSTDDTAGFTFSFAVR